MGYNRTDQGKDCAISDFTTLPDRGQHFKETLATLGVVLSMTHWSFGFDHKKKSMILQIGHKAKVISLIPG